ncbi:SulP family inorganic anion transporter, partial [Thalassolituus sp. UBA6592]|uniref:SulP family inorganic anion transporter n=1 Tax=Thalassolituus sp. UBA6592 TaxID=1947665 RepID=UPI0025E36948
FVNGLAIVIFLAQLGQFKVTGALGTQEWMSGTMLYIMLGLVALTMAIIYLLPKLTKAVPASLAAIITITLLVHGLDMEARTVIDFVRDMLPVDQRDSATLAGELPTFAIPMVPFNWDTLMIILPTSVILCLVGLIESLLTLTLIDEMTDTRGRGNKECVAQGTANIVTGFFGGMGGCAMIGQSMINVSSGGRGRLSGIAAALFLLSFILFASPLIEEIPIAALVGVMFMVVIGTFEWTSFRIMRKIPKHDAFVLVLVSGVTVVTDLAIAVIVGVIVSALVFAWEHAKRIRVTTREDENAKIYDLVGPLFFGSVTRFKDLFDVENDPQMVIIDFRYSRVADHSALEAIDHIAERYLAAGKELRLRHLSEDCRVMLKKAGNLCDVNVIEDPNYRVALDELG